MSLPWRLRSDPRRPPRFRQRDLGPHPDAGVCGRRGLATISRQGKCHQQLSFVRGGESDAERRQERRRADCRMRALEPLDFSHLFFSVKATERRRRWTGNRGGQDRLRFCLAARCQLHGRRGVQGGGGGLHCLTGRQGGSSGMEQAVLAWAPSPSLGCS